MLCCRHGFSYYWVKGYLHLGFVVPCTFNRSNKNTQLDATINRKIYCFVVQTLLNMFRALPCPSSGARETAVAASGFRMNVEVEVFSAVVVLLANRPRLRTLPPPHSYGNQRLQRQFYGFLMMGIVMPETCWAVSVGQSNKFYDWFLHLVECFYLRVTRIIVLPIQTVSDLGKGLFLKILCNPKLTCQNWPHLHSSRLIGYVYVFTKYTRLICCFYQFLCDTREVIYI